MSSSINTTINPTLADPECCAICYDELSPKEALLAKQAFSNLLDINKCCSHIFQFHEKCLKEWIDVRAKNYEQARQEDKLVSKPDCPLCRKVIWFNPEPVKTEELEPEPEVAAEVEAEPLPEPFIFQRTQPEPAQPEPIRQLTREEVLARLPTAARRAAAAARSLVRPSEQPDPVQQNEPSTARARVSRVKALRTEVMSHRSLANRITAVHGGGSSRSISARPTTAHSIRGRSARGLRTI